MAGARGPDSEKAAVVNLPLSYIIWGFPKIRGTFLGVPIIRTIVFGGVYIGVPLFWESTNWLFGVYASELRHYCKQVDICTTV